VGVRTGKSGLSGSSRIADKQLWHDLSRALQRCRSLHADSKHCASRRKELEIAYVEEDEDCLLAWHRW